VREQERHAENTGRFADASGHVGRLEILYQDKLVAEFRLPKGRAIIGRTSDNDVQIQSRFVSRHHAQVVSDQAQSVVEDLNSTNGVFIRSQRVKQQVLADGDIIQIGEHKLLYRDMRGAMRHLVPSDDDEDDDEIEKEGSLDEDELDEDELDEDEIDEAVNDNRR